jgi:hypothetical protein
VLARSLLASLLVVALAAPALAWRFSYGAATANRVAGGPGTFPRVVVISTPAESPFRWVVSMPQRRLAAIDANGTLWIFEIAPTSLIIIGRYGDAASPDGPPVAVSLGDGRPGVVCVSREGLLLVWQDGGLRAFDVGAPLSRLTFPIPVVLDAKGWDDLVAVAADGAVVLIGGLLSAPRVVARAEVRALPDARITLGSLDGSGELHALVLTDPTDRYPHGALGDKLEATSVAVIAVGSNALSIRGRYVVPEPAVLEDLIPLVLPIGEGGRPGVVVIKSAPRQGSSILVLGWRAAGLEFLAEGPVFGQKNRWVHVIGAADLSGDGIPELIAVNSPHLAGVLVAYDRRAASLVPSAKALGYSSHAVGSRNQDQAAIANMSGSGRLQIIVPRQSREVLAALELSGTRWEERWALQLGSPIQSNLLVADLDGDGLLDLVVADRRALHVFLSIKPEGGR